MITIEITVKGKTASGKTLAIADMLVGLKDQGHFVAIGENNIHMTTDGEEYRTFTAILRRQSPIEHEP